MSLLLLKALGLLVTIIAMVPARSEPLLRTCEPIRVEMCSGLGYNVTGMPNLGGNELQKEADYTLKTFSPLIQYGCSAHLKLFLCSVYVPMCTEKVANPIGPCRGLCESVRSKCFPVLQGFGFPWPDALNCSRFPVENNHEHMCMEGPKDLGVDVTAPVVPAVHPSTASCPPQHARGEISGKCTPLCESDILFDNSEKRFAEVWVTVWASLCFVSSLGAALTLSIGGGRVRARPLLSLTLCYTLASVGWGLRLILGRNATACQPQGILLLAEDGLSNPNCAIVFLLVYYFGQAASIWWVCLCGWWVARAGLAWPPEKLRSLGSLMHVAAWGLPAAQTVAALVRRDVDADELTGVCYVGNQNLTTLLTLVLLPQALYLVVGAGLLVTGVVLTARRPKPSAAAPLTATAPRKESDLLGALCALYVIPMACTVAAIAYEYWGRDGWITSTRRPALWVFLLKQFSSMAIGVSAVAWVWAGRSVAAWKAILRRLGPRKSPPVKCQKLPVLRYVPPPTMPPKQHPAVSQAVTMSSSSRATSVGQHSYRKPRLHHHRGLGGGETVL